jgi:hypothetical protein
MALTSTFSIFSDNGLSVIVGSVIIIAESAGLPDPELLYWEYGKSTANDLIIAIAGNTYYVCGTDSFEKYMACYLD